MENIKFLKEELESAVIWVRNIESFVPNEE
jgi:hypothetical protein